MLAVIVDGAAWRADPSAVVETFFVLKDRGRDGGTAASAMRERFIDAFGLEASAVPLVTLDPHEWRSPFA